jgi:hypothetical protein
MKSIRISDEAYKYLRDQAESNRRSITSTLDLIIEEYIKNGDRKRSIKRFNPKAI